MTSETHSKSSEVWLWFFFVCFVIVLVGIGLFAVADYPHWLNPSDSPPAGGGHGMILPHQIPDLAQTARA